MASYATCSDLKTAAKDMLVGKYRTIILIVFLSQSISFFALEIVSRLVPIYSVPSMVVNLCLSAAISILTGVLNVGIAYVFLKIACEQEYSANDLFIGYREQPEKSIIIALVFSGTNFLCMTPWQILFRLYLNTGANSYLTGTLVALGIGLLVYIPIHLAISQSFYLMLDFPEYEATQVLQTSIRIMKEHKTRLLYLEASFIPLAILSVLTFFIGFLWLIPYMQMTLTLFYLDLMEPN